MTCHRLKKKWWQLKTKIEAEDMSWNIEKKNYWNYKLKLEADDMSLNQNIMEN